MKKPNGRSSSPANGTRLSAEWREFASRLAQHVPVLGPDQVLILSEPKSHRFVQIAMQGSWGLKLEAVTDNYLEPDDRLSGRDAHTMRGLGWTPPLLPTPDADADANAEADAEADDDANAEADAEADDEDGSLSWTMHWPAPVPHADAALLVVRTVAGVFHVRHPALLQYYAFVTDGPTILLPGLGIPAEPPPMSLEATTARSVDAQVEDACIAAADADVRRDGDVYLLEVDGVSLRVAAEPDTGVVRIVSRVMPVDDIGGDLFELMNRLNGTYLSYGYVFVRDGDVRWATELVDTAVTAQALTTALSRAAEAVKGVLALTSTL